MLRMIRNLIVHIMAAFIRDQEERHKFRNKYKEKSKFRKLRDDNIRLFNDIKNLRAEFAELKRNYDKHLYEMEFDRYLEFRVKPIDDSPPQGPDSAVYLSIVCVSKNEGAYLKEWIEYHMMLGVERFYFYDNESDDNTKEVLSTYIKNGTLVYHYLPNHPITKLRPQVEAYNDAIFKYRDKTRWMALIDIDEFIVPVQKNSINGFLMDYEQFPAVVVNWVCFDSNGHNKKPVAHGGLVTANYTRVRKDHNVYKDKLVKSIVNPKLVVKYISPHDGLYYLNNWAVTENFEKTRGQTTRFHSSNKIRINHYLTKSREEYVNKIIRNRKGSHVANNYNNIDESFLNFKEEAIQDLVIQKYISKLKLNLGIKD